MKNRKACPMTYALTYAYSPEFATMMCLALTIAPSAFRSNPTSVKNSFYV